MACTRITAQCRRRSGASMVEHVKTFGLSGLVFVLTHGYFKTCVPSVGSVVPIFRSRHLVHQHSRFFARLGGQCTWSGHLFFEHVCQDIRCVRLGFNLYSRFVKTSVSSVASVGPAPSRVKTFFVQGTWFTSTVVFQHVWLANALGLCHDIWFV